MSETLTEVLAEHEPHKAQGDLFCECGEWELQFRDFAETYADHLATAVLGWVEARLAGAREGVARGLCESVNPGGHGWREHRDDWRRDADAALDVVCKVLGVEVGS